MHYAGPLNTYDTAEALFELPAGGTLRAASFQRVVDGKIVSYLQAFDATELRKLSLGGK